MAQLPVIRYDGQGYRYDGESVEGFKDRPELPLDVRVMIARIARAVAPHRLSCEQIDLLAAQPEPSERRPGDRERTSADPVDAPCREERQGGGTHASG